MTIMMMVVITMAIHRNKRLKVRELLYLIIITNLGWSFFTKLDKDVLDLVVFLLENNDHNRIWFELFE